MNAIPFTKMSGLGNDFIIVDNRSALLEEIELRKLAKRLCKRRLSLGADELMIIENPTGGGDFSMRTFNPDGNEVEMCGNASRCVARYAYTHKIAGACMTIDTLGGPVQAWVEGDAARVHLQVTTEVRLNHRLIIEGDQIDVHMIAVSGTPHAVLFQTNLFGMPDETLHRIGASIRYHPEFPNGINANFVQVVDPHHLMQRTYERGVESETLACGTGAVASSIISAALGWVQSPVTVQTTGGDLDVTFKQQDYSFQDIFLGGGARFVAEGTLHPEAWAW